MDKIDELKQKIKQAEINLEEARMLLEQELKKTEPKYFVGQYLKHKETGGVGIITEIDRGDTHTISYLFPSTHKSYWCNREIQQYYDIIPYPWKEFIKVGDIYMDTRNGVTFTIVREDNNKGYYIHGDHGNHHYYSFNIVLYCIKIGESHEQTS